MGDATAGAPEFKIDSRNLLSALDDLEQFGKRYPAQVQAFGLSLNMDEGLYTVRVRRSGWTLEPSALLRGFLIGVGSLLVDLPDEPDKEGEG